MPEFLLPANEHWGVIHLDEYNDPPWPGCNAAVDEFLTGRPEYLRVIALDNYEKYYIDKE
jgi:hypothetical protein